METSVKAKGENKRAFFDVVTDGLQHKNEETFCLAYIKESQKSWLTKHHDYNQLLTILVKENTFIHTSFAMNHKNIKSCPMNSDI